MPSECDSYKDCYKAQVNSKWKIFEKKGYMFYIWMSIVYYLKLMIFVILQNSQNVFKQWTRYWKQVLKDGRLSCMLY